MHCHIPESAEDFPPSPPSLLKQTHIYAHINVHCYSAMYVLPSADIETSEQVSIQRKLIQVEPAIRLQLKLQCQQN